MKKKSIKAEDFDNLFDNGEDILDYLDISQLIKPGQEQKRVNLDFPIWMIQSLGKEARELGATHRSITKVWIADRLKELVH